MQTLRLQTPAILWWQYVMLSDVNLNDIVPWRPIQPVKIKHVKILDFYLSHGTGKGVCGKIY